MNFRRRFSALLLLFLVAGSFSRAGYAADCALLFRSLATANHGSLTRGFRESLDRLPPDEAQRIQSIVDSLYFVDFDDAASELLEVFQGGKALKQARIDFKYEESLSWGEAMRNLFGRAPQSRPKVLQNFLEAQESLKSGRGQELTRDQLLRAHREAMKGGVEGISKAELGVIREIEVVGEAMDKGVSEKALATLRENPYLDFQAFGTDDATRITRGKILYPKPESAKPEVIRRLESQDAALAAEVRKLQKSGKAVSPDLRKRFISALLDERLQWFERQRNEIGRIDSPEKLEAYVKLVADLQRDFVSIHPFRNGNGRMSRALLFELLEREDLPPPRFLNVDDDLYATPEELRDKVFRGIVSTQRLYDDLIERTRSGLPLESSPELFSPSIPNTIGLNLKKQGSRSLLENQREATVDGAQFATWLKLKFRDESGAKELFRRDPVGQLERHTDEFVRFEKKHRLDFVHQKDGVKEVSVNFVDDDFRALFANHSYQDPRSWQRKIERWYEAEQTVWRGLAYKDRDVPEDEIVGMFRELHPQMVSNESAGAANSAERMKRVNKDFDRYNTDLFKGDLYKMTKDHSETGPMYGSSYGYSTSKKREVGKAFAMGAMVVGKYGEHQEMQHLLKSRILVGAYKSKKDIDLARFYHIDQRFIYAYPRQMEVMGVGAADPDSIMVVQKISAEGKVDLTYARDPARPNVLWVVKGEFEPKPGTAPEPASVVREIRLE